MAEQDWMDEPARAHSERATREAHRDWNAKNHRGRVLDAEREVINEVQSPASLPVAVSRGSGLINPLEADPEAFGKALRVRTQNRNTLVAWVRDALVRGVDFDKIHVVSRRNCTQGKACTNPDHWSKDQLFKPGAEKICGMLSVRPSFPNLGAYEDAAIRGDDIKHVVLRCHILSIDERVLSEGVGAASISENGYSLNKTLKIAAKSSHIDAVLKLGGLSEVFVHPEATPAAATAREEPDPTLIPAGKYQGQPWAEVSDAYLAGIEASPKPPEVMKQGAKAERERRGKQYAFDDDIPF